MNGLARTVLHILLFIMFCYFQRGRMDGIQEFQSIMLNLKNKRKMQGKEVGRNMLAHRWCLIYYYAYCLYVRDGPQLSLFYGGKLF